MKRRLMAIMLVMVVLLATTTPIFAQTEQSPTDIPAPTGTDTPQLETSQVETPTAARPHDCQLWWRKSTRTSRDS